MMNSKNKIAIMQPYLFPYIGYFQLLNSVDYFGIGDDVQYIKGGWINRNQLFFNNKVETFTFSVAKDSSSKLIKDKYFHDNFKQDKGKFLRKLEIFYKKAPFYASTVKIINEIFESDENNISLFNTNQLKILCKHLNIDVKIIPSLEWDQKIDTNLLREEKVTSKLNSLKGKYEVSTFINPLGGSELYSKVFFEKNRIELLFLESKKIVYKQFNAPFHENLSVIDIMMFNSLDQIGRFLNEYTLK